MSEDFRTVIVPNDLRDAINAKLEVQYALSPNARIDYDIHYAVLLAYFDKHGALPEFELRKAVRDEAR